MTVTVYVYVRGRFQHTNEFHDLRTAKAHAQSRAEFYQDQKTPFHIKVSEQETPNDVLFEVFNPAGCLGTSHRR